MKLEVVEAFVLLVVAPDPAADLAVGVVADLANDGLADDGGEAASSPLVFEALAAGAEAVLVLAFLRDSAVAVVAVGDAAGVVAKTAQAADAIGAVA